MSEQKVSYMASLDAWIDIAIIGSLADAYRKDSEGLISDAEQFVRKAIREKVLESYRNGQVAGPRKVFKRR